MKPRAIAFYLPQYHPIPENDDWWGKGFTEWINVTKARPLFKGHYQPQLPADLGFYDLRVPEARGAQAALASEYGIHGFCYYHYWFHGKRLLERPFNDVLEAGKPSLPFCLCWANENWTRRWDGLDAELLIEQQYSPEDDLNHIRWLIRAFKDSRYIKVDGKPLLLIYRFSRLPEPARTMEVWDQEARKAGFPGIFLCNVESDAKERGFAARYPLGGAVEFAPDWTVMPTPLYSGRVWNLARRFSLVRRMLPKFGVMRYDDLVKNMLEKPVPRYRRFMGVTPSWDNTPRRKNDPCVFVDSEPSKYAAWLKEAVQRSMQHPESQRIVFINAWNEWAEGNHLEPCQRWGRGYLEATRNALA